MLAALKKLTGSNKPLQAAIPDGERVYAVGDIHGRLDLFDALLEAIDEDSESRGTAQVSLILLGDLIDRGPDSAGVIKRARQLKKHGNVRILMGNHEEMFLDAFEDTKVLRHFLRFGGRETFLSYPIEKKIFRDASLEELSAIIAEAVPEKHRKFVAKFENSVTIGDYVFVHAGIRPGLPLDEQRQQDLRWIREPFLSHKKPHHAMVVHGHTISDEVEHRKNRIGIDTGAYMTGRLTALGLEGTERWLVEAKQGKKGKISIVQRNLT